MNLFLLLWKSLHFRRLSGTSASGQVCPECKYISLKKDLRKRKKRKKTKRKPPKQKSAASVTPPVREPFPIKKIANWKNPKWRWNTEREGLVSVRTQLDRPSRQNSNTEPPPTKEIANSKNTKQMQKKTIESIFSLRSKAWKALRECK